MRQDLPVLQDCRPTGVTPPLTRDQAEATATLLRAVADPVRLQLLALISASPSGEHCVCDLTDAVGLAQPTVSHHLKILTAAGLVRRQQRGTWAWYALVPERLDELGEFLGALAHAAAGSQPSP